jgi:hypothetical protein
MKPTILFLFNSSSYAPQPWLDDGRFNCVSVDYCGTDHDTGTRVTTGSSSHYRLSIDLSQPDSNIEVDWHLWNLKLAPASFVLSFAPCTDLAVSGARHFKSKLAADPQCQSKAVAVAKLATKFNCPYMVENPVSVLATKWKKPAAYMHPWHFAHLCPLGAHPEFPDVIPSQDRYNKKTGLWCGNGAIVPLVGPYAMKPEETVNPGWQKLGGKSARTKYIRSLTPRGLANAIYLANKDVILSQKGLDNMTEWPVLCTPQSQRGT